mmetsp:Transcript_25088/g.77376  ORF Transcript_25088/g.77376 Transcript_25088/m.77376 type:complete len:160 (+) Transcript_25088:149-628(+)
MATRQPLLAKPGASGAKHTRASIFYGADEYLDELKKKYEHDHEIASMKAILPDGGDPNAGAGGAGQDKMTSIHKNDENRSHKTGRLFPTPNKPDPMPPELAFLFTKITAEQMMYMWNILTLIFVAQCSMVVAYCAALALLPEGDDYWWAATLTAWRPLA